MDNPLLEHMDSNSEFPTPQKRISTVKREKLRGKTPVDVETSTTFKAHSSILEPLP